MKTEVYWVQGRWPGRLGIVPRPRGGDWLEDEMRSWQDAGLDIVASLLTSGEEAELGLQEEKTLARKEGLDFRSFQIPDYGVPSSRADFAGFLRGLAEALESGQNVAVHCCGGIGRSSLTVAALLVSAGEEPDEAFRNITTARGRDVPDTDEQRRWVAELPEG